MKQIFRHDGWNHPVHADLISMSFEKNHFLWCEAGHGYGFDTMGWVQASAVDESFNRHDATTSCHEDINPLYAITHFSGFENNEQNSYRHMVLTQFGSL